MFHDERQLIVSPVMRTNLTVVSHPTFCGGAI